MLSATERPRAAVPTPAVGARAFELLGGGVLRYGLVLLLLGGGLAKFTEAEALAIQPWVANSPVMGWLYGLASLQGVSNLIGVVEISLAVLLAVGRWWPRLSAVGSVGASVQFLITLSFLFTTPGLSPEIQGFLAKDLILLGAALWTAGESLRAARSSR
jgi:reactive chlorine resistance protein C